MFWVFLLSFLAVLLAFYYIKSHQNGLAPGPIGIPILGYLPFIDPHKPYETFSNLAKKYGNIFGVQLGSIYTVVLCDANIIREALKKDEFTGRAPLFITHGIMGGYGLICAEGKLWKDQRKLTIEWLRKMGMLKFGASRADLEKRMMVQINDCIKGLERLSKQSFVSNPKPILHHTLGNLMNDLVFGKVYSFDDETWKYLQNLQEEGVKYIGISGAVNFLPFLRFLPNNKSIIKFLLNGKQKTHKIYDDIIHKVQQTLDYKAVDEGDSKSSNIIEYFLKEKYRRDQVDHVTCEHFCEEQFRHLLADLFGAGLDTTLTTIMWFILYMAQNSAVQRLVSQELGKKCGGAPTLDDFENLPYLKACISETQRIRSVVPVGIPHGANVDTEFHGFKIPKNTMIMPLQWSVHMNPEHFPDPERFDPNRFLDENGQYYVPTNFLPFQTGKRMCLGDELAKMILYLYCGHILYNFQIEVSAIQKFDMTGTCGITLTPPEYEIILKQRITASD